MPRTFALLSLGLFCFPKCLGRFLAPDDVVANWVCEVHNQCQANGELAHRTFKPGAFAGPEQVVNAQFDESAESRNRSQ